LTHYNKLFTEVFSGNSTIKLATSKTKYTKKTKDKLALAQKKLAKTQFVKINY